MSKEDFWIAFHAWNAVNENEMKEQIRRNLIAKLLGHERAMRAEKKSAPKFVSAKDRTHTPSPGPESWFDLDLDEIKNLRLRLKNTTQQNFHKLLKRIGI